MKLVFGVVPYDGADMLELEYFGFEDWFTDKFFNEFVCKNKIGTSWMKVPKKYNNPKFKECDLYIKYDEGEYKNPIYRNICNHKVSNNLNLHSLKIDEDAYLSCGICPPLLTIIQEEKQASKEMVKILEMVDNINSLGVNIPSQLQKELDVVKELIEFSIEDK